jgi:hypothetical protein
VADLAAPTVVLQNPSPWAELAPGAPFTVQAHANDNLAVSRGPP